jgi:hypothetical protein
MKRLVLALLFAIVPAALFAQAVDRDVLLSSEGTLYTVESTDNDGSAPADVTRFLLLTVQRGNQKAQRVPVPGSLSAGIHWRPALAYDTDTRTLFVFWLKNPNAMSSELLLAAYSNGRWQPAVSIDNQPFHLRYNLRIGITTRIAQLQSGGAYVDAPALLLHAAWWEETGYGEVARYGLFSVEGGRVSLIELHDLNEFVTPYTTPTAVDPDFNPEILRHPAFVDNGTANSVDVIFGDKNYAVFNRVTLKPIADGRIHIPIGAHPGGPRTPAPKSGPGDWNGRISTITSPHSGKLLLFNTTKDSVSYIMFSSGSWSSMKTVALSDRLSADAAVAVLSRMLNQ